MGAKNDPRISFLIDMGRALHSYGIPAHRLEDALGNTAARLGIRAEFFSGPTSLIASFGKPGEQHTSLSRVSPGQLQLDKLVELDSVVESLYREEIGVETADARLHEIDGAPPRFGPLATIIAFGFSSATVVRFFAGGYAEIGAALFLGLVTGTLAVGLARTNNGSRIFEFIAAAMVTFLATAFSMLVLPLSLGMVVIASLIVLLPGLGLTLALNELSTGHLVSGTARFAGAIMTFMKIGIGAAVGRQAGHFLPGDIPVVDPATPPAWTLWTALIIVPIALSVLFRARRQELPWIALGTTVAYWGTHYGVSYLGPLLGAAVGACLSGLAANGFARLKRRPAVVLVVPSLILLVPGSIGYSSLELMMQSDMLSGLDTAVTTMLVGVSLVAGLLLSSVLVPPRNAL